MKQEKNRIAVIIPCYNEETTIRQVVADFKKALPAAEIHVFDNNSNDKTSYVAKRAGAIVHFVALPGKGNVVRRMFADTDADIYVMVDGDATYDAFSSTAMISKLTSERLDMVVGCRSEKSKDNKNYRPGHRIGNKLLTESVQRMFNGHFTDMLSGYRVFSRRFVKTFPAESSGFEIETELTVHTLGLKMSYGEVLTPYFERPEGSESKLSTYKDGFRIIAMIIRLYSNERPSRFWAIIGSIFLITSLILMFPVIADFIQTGQVLRFPTVIVASGIMVVGFLSGTIGLVLRTVTRGRNEAKHIAYLRIPPPSDA